MVSRCTVRNTMYVSKAEHSMNLFAHKINQDGTVNHSVRMQLLPKRRHNGAHEGSCHSWCTIPLLT